MIEKNKPVLVIRFNSFQKFDFINEHKKSLQKNGFVWMVKLGKKVPQASLQMFLEAGGHLLLKAPKKEGNQFYYAQFSDFRLGTPSSGMIYPAYYEEMITSSLDYTLDGTWLKVNSICKIDDNHIDYFHLISTGNPLRTIIDSTRTATLYVESDRPFEVGGE